LKYPEENVYRLLDANMNRSLEGIRVMEETARMLFDDSELTSSLKNIRHELIGIIKKEKNLSRKMLSARDSERDVLRNGETESEQSRNGVSSIVSANAHRAQEAVRSMEEYVKLSFSGLSEQFKRIRFRLYDIEKSLVLRINSHELTGKGRLELCVLIENNHLSQFSIHNETRSAFEGGAGTLVFQDRLSNDRDFFMGAEEFLNACHNEKVTTILEGRLDCAMILGADGVQLNEECIPVKASRTFSGAGDGFVIGYSISGKSFFEDVKIDEVDYLLLESFNDSSHLNLDELKKIRTIADKSPVPVVVLCDGVKETVELALECGITGISVKITGSKSFEIKKIRDIIDEFNSGS
jgi:thiamine-phosphate pyrophosphorylase